MYIPSKPGRYGIKIWAMCDSANSYLFNAKIYCGKEGAVQHNQGENVVKYLASPIYKTGRNITTDNFFTTLCLARFLLHKNWEFLALCVRTKLLYLSFFSHLLAKKVKVFFCIKKIICWWNITLKKQECCFTLNTRQIARN